MKILDELLAATSLKLPDSATDEFWEQLVRALADEAIVDVDAWTALSEPAQEWANTGMRAVKERKKKARLDAAGGEWAGEAESLEISPLVAIESDGSGEPEPESKPEPEPFGCPYGRDLEPETETEPETEPETETETEPEPEPEPESKSELGPLGLNLPEEVESAAVAPLKRAKRAGKKSSGKKKAVAKKARSKPEPEPEPKSKSAKKASKKKAAKRAKKTRRPAAFKTGHCYHFIRLFVSSVTTIDECDPEVLLERFKDQGVQLTKASANMMMYDTITVLRVLRDLKRYKHPLLKEFPEPEAPDDDID